MSAQKTSEHAALRESFDRDGIAVVKGFASKEECEKMMSRMNTLIDKWDATQDVTAFSTDKDQEKTQGSSSYFLDSADRIHFFLETAATQEDGKTLKPEFSKFVAINKVGHGLHVEDEVFKEYATSDKVKSLSRTLGWVAPVLPQSMYIFKQPEIGGQVTSHQDSTFLYTEPRQTCLGLWLALQDATLENGCLWARKGSHQEPVRRHFCRNPAYFDGDTSQPMMIFEDVDTSCKNVTWEGGFPDGGDIEAAVRSVGFEPLPVKQGDVVLIHGAVDHLSLPNTSIASRHTFQLHLIEGPTEGIKWSEKNWLQYPKEIPFPPC